MQRKGFTMDPSGNDALPLEYKLKERRAIRHLRVPDLVDNAEFLGLRRANKGGLQKEAFDFLGTNVCPFVDNLLD